MIGWENDRGAYFINKLQEQVNAIESETSDIGTDIGDVSNLTTTDKTSLVNAINEVDGNVDTATQNIGTLSESIGTISELRTSATNLVGAVNEVLAKTVKDLGTVTAGSSKVYDVAVSSKIFVFAFGAALVRFGAWQIFTTSSGNFIIQPIYTAGSEITINGSGSTKTLTIGNTNSGTSALYLYALVIDGNITEHTGS